MVSIIIINYKTFEITSNCLRSVYKHTKDIDFEVILVDNASPNEDPDAFLKEFPNITLIKSPINLGFAKGNNLGLKYAKGEVILLLNSDVILLENSIKICAEQLLANSNLAAVSPKLVYENGQINTLADLFPSVKEEFLKLVYLNKYNRKSNKHWGKFYRGEVFTCDSIWGAFFMVKRSVIEMLPEQKLPDTFFMYAEDIEWCYEIKKQDMDILYYPKTTAIHLGSKSSQSKQDTILTNIIVPNHYVLLKKMRGTLYAKTYFLLRAFNFFKSSKTLYAKAYIKQVF